jgi:hypothetical protein
MSYRPDIYRSLSEKSTNWMKMHFVFFYLDMTSGDVGVKVEGSTSTFSMGVSSNATSCSSSRPVILGSIFSSSPLSLLLYDISEDDSLSFDNFPPF